MVYSHCILCQPFRSWTKAHIHKTSLGTIEKIWKRVNKHFSNNRWPRSMQRFLYEFLRSFTKIWSSSLHFVLANQKTSLISLWIFLKTEGKGKYCTNLDLLAYQWRKRNAIRSLLTWGFTDIVNVNGRGSHWEVRYQKTDKTCN